MTGDFDPCWIVWEAAQDGGRPYLLAIDTSEEQADLHVRAARDGARLLGKVGYEVRVEQSFLDHLYGESMTKNFDQAKKMMREVIRAQRDELRRRLRETIEMARTMASVHVDKAQRKEWLAKLAQLEACLPPQPAKATP